MSSAKSLSVVSVAFALQTIFSMIFYLVSARTLPVDEVGAITIFLSLGSILNVGFSLNLHTGFTHFMSYSNGKKKAISIPRFYLVISTVLMFVAFIAIYLLSHYIAIAFFHSSNYNLIVIVMGIFIIANMGFGYSVGLLQGMQLFRLAGVSNILTSTLTYGTPILLSLLKQSVTVISIGFATGISISSIISLIFVLKSRVTIHRSERSEFRTFFIYVIPIFLGMFFSTLMAMIDRVILPALSSLTVAAVYTYALTIATVVTALTYPFQFFLLPKISHYFGSSEKTKLKQHTVASLELFYFIALPASIGVTILSKPILVVLVGGIYASYYHVLQIMVFSYSFFSFRPIISSILLGMRRTKVYMYSGGAAFLANVVISLTLIPYFGIYGAVSASISAWAVSTIPRMFAVRSPFAHGISIVPFLKMWVNVTVMAAVVFLVMTGIKPALLSLLVSIVSGMAVYFAVSALNRPFSIDSRSLIRSIAPSGNVLVKFTLRVFFGVNQADLD